jgi:hypothetical protein
MTALRRQPPIVVRAGTSALVIRVDFIISVLCGSSRHALSMPTAGTAPDEAPQEREIAEL